MLSFWSRLRGNQAQSIHCLGDSHVDMLKILADRRMLADTHFEFCVVRGATNMGLANPRSNTHAGEIFSAYLQKHVQADDAAIFCLGEVDCGFVIWYRAEKYSLSVNEQLELSLGNYKKLLDQALARCPRIAVISVPLPTIQDGPARGEVANERGSVRTALKDRTELTLTYNARLAQFCAKRNLHYVDLQTPTLDEQTLSIRSEFLNPDPADHHMNYDKVAPVLLKAMVESNFLRP